MVMAQACSKVLPRFGYHHQANEAGWAKWDLFRVLLATWLPLDLLPLNLRHDISDRRVRHSIVSLHLQELSIHLSITNELCPSRTRDHKLRFKR